MDIIDISGQKYLMRMPHSGGPTVLFLHGFPDNAYVWEPVISHIDQGHFNILAPFAPGTYEGDSFSSKSYSLERMCSKYLKDLRDLEVDLGKLVIVCHDMGGVYAHHMMRKLPGNAKLIVINSLSPRIFLQRYNSFKQVLKSSYMFLFQLPIISKSVLEKFNTHFGKKVYEQVGLATELIPRKYNGNIFNGIHFYKSLGKEVKNLINFPMIGQEVFLFIGRKDPFLMMPTDKELKGAYRSFLLESFEQGHWPQLEIAEELAVKINTIGGQYE